MVTETQSCVLQVLFSSEGTDSPPSSRGICLRGLAHSETSPGSPQLESSQSASCYSGVFVPQKVWKNTSEMNKPSRPKAAGMTFCGLVAPDFISTLRSKARLLHLTFPLLFQIQEQGILHPSTHRSALKGASSDFIGNQHLSPLLATSLSLS